MYQLRYVPPRHEKLKQYIQGYYFFEASNKYPFTYVIYPNSDTAVAFYAEANVETEEFNIRFKSGNTHGVKLIGRYMKPCLVHFEEFVPEFIIMFRPFGVNRFIPNFFERFGESETFSEFDDDTWLDFAQKLPGESDYEDHIRSLEDMLLQQYVRFEDEQLFRFEEGLGQLQETLRIEDIAAQLQLSAKTLARRFKSHMGCSPAQYRKLLRFRRALRLRLDDPEFVKLTHIGNESGFYDQAHFIREFRSLTGESPKKYFESIAAPREHIILKPL